MNTRTLIAFCVSITLMNLSRAQTSPAGQAAAAPRAVRRPPKDIGNNERFHVLAPPEMTQRSETRPNPARLAEKRAKELLRLGRLAAAEKECRRAIALTPIGQNRADPGYFRRPAMRLLGEILVRRGRNREAVQAFLSSCEKPPVRGHFPGLALAYCRLGDFEKARSLFASQGVLNYIPKEFRNEFAPYLPGVANLRALEASILLARGVEHSVTADPAQALPEFLAAHKLYPANGFIAQAAGTELMMLDRWDEAEFYLKIAVESGPARLVKTSKEYLSSIAQRRARLQREAQGRRP